MEKKLKSVLCQWPRLDKAYKFSASESRSVQTEATDPDGSYEVTLVLTEPQAKDLASDMRKTFEAEKQAGWADWSPQALTDVFKKMIPAITSPSCAKKPTATPAQSRANGCKTAVPLRLIFSSRPAARYTPQSCLKRGQWAADPASHCAPSISWWST